MSTRETYVLRNGKLIEKWRAPPLVEVFDTGPMVISDSMPSTRHMASGKYFDSKAAFRAETKAHGCIELGNEMPTLTRPRKPIPLDRRKRRDDVKKAIYDLKNSKR